VHIFRIVVLNDANLIREAFNDPVMNGRPNNKVFRSLEHGDFGILSIDGPNWMEQRKFTLRHLKEFGFGKNQMENLILEEVKVVIENFKADEGNSIELSRRFTLAIVNSLWVIMTGSRIEHNDRNLHEVLENLFK
jgi:methyl farnesoate epoxidase/farnesoate epoxidase